VTSGDHASPAGRLFRRIVPPAVDAIDPDSLIERIDVNALLDRVDVDRVLDRIDVNRVLGRADMDMLIRQVAVDALLAEVDVDGLVDRVDVDRLMDRVDVDRLLARVALDALLRRVDVNALLDRVDVNRLLDRVDVNHLLDRVLVQPLVDRVDVNALVGRVDVETVVHRAGVENLVTRGATGMAFSTLDLLRRQLVGVDVVMLRIGDRLMRRKQTPVTDARRASVTGQYAGPVSRLLAAALDATLITAIFTTTLTVGIFLFNLFTGQQVNFQLSTAGPIWIGIFIAWGVLYLWVSTVLAGRTPGKALVGLRVLADDGGPLKAKPAIIRVLVLPISCILFLGLLGIEFGRRRKALHDLAAHSIVIYDWGDRTAEMPAPLTRWLAKRGLDEEALPARIRPQ
jgi:uncharacterized RDD family membrane protein YckC